MMQPLGKPERGFDKHAPPELALFGALCLFLSAAEHLIPKPFPFLRLGLSNLPLLAALTFPPNAGAGKRPLPLFSPRNFALLALLKFTGQALVTGTLFSYAILFSFAGTLASTLIMYTLRRAAGNRISLAGTGIAGALASNAAQLLLARWYLFGEAAAYFAPPFLAVGIITGAALGIFSEHFAAQSLWLVSRFQKVPFSSYDMEITQNHTAISPLEAPFPPHDTEIARTSGGSAASFLFSFSTITAILVAAAFFFIPGLVAKAVLCAVLGAACMWSGCRVRPFAALVLAAGITACNLYPPAGKILARLGPFIIADGSLSLGIGKALQFQGLFFLSALVTRRLVLPGSFGALLTESFRLLRELDKRKGILIPQYSRRETTSGGGLIKRLDALLLEVSGDTVSSMHDNG
jgi:heptaprenyl diphosphate synthase